MKKLFLFAPQWQDSGMTNELYSGAYALKRYFRTISEASFREVIVEPETDISLENNIYGYSVIREQLSQIDKVLKSDNPEKIVALGGGCGIEVPIVSYLSSKYSSLKIFWFDAHGDLNSPETSPSKYFHGMPLRFITEKQKNGIGDMFRTVSPRNVNLLGTRDLDPPEETYIKENKINVIKIDSHIESQITDIITPDEPAFIHIDLDVIDPGDYRNVKCPVKDGLKVSELEKYIKMIARQMNVAAISIVENTETDIEKVRTLKEILEIALHF